MERPPPPILLTKGGQSRADLAHSGWSPRVSTSFLVGVLRTRKLLRSFAFVFWAPPTSRIAALTTMPSLLNSVLSSSASGGPMRRKPPSKKSSTAFLNWVATPRGLLRGLARDLALLVHEQADVRVTHVSRKLFRKVTNVDRVCGAVRFTDHRQVKHRQSAGRPRASRRTPPWSRPTPECKCLPVFCCTQPSNRVTKYCRGIAPISELLTLLVGDSAAESSTGCSHTGKIAALKTFVPSVRVTSWSSTSNVISP